LGLNPTEYFLGIDYGASRTGLAIGNTFLKIAQPLEMIAIKDDSQKISKIKEIVVKWHINKIVLGIPTLQKHSNSSQSIIKRIEDFANNLKHALNLEIIMTNEDFSSYEAAQILHSQDISGYKQKMFLDSMAACVILQQYFDEGTYRK
jgi:putative Holliday junction resolvase